MSLLLLLPTITGSETAWRANWETALTNVATTPATILCIGDSVTEGQGSLSERARWVAQLSDYMHTKYPVATGGPGYLAAKLNTYAESTWTTYSASSGTITLVTTAGNLGYRAASMPAAATLTFTVTGTSADIWWVRSASGGSFTWKVDAGTTSGAISTAGTAATNTKTTISLGTAGSHTILITCSAGTTLISGVMVYNGDETKGVRVYEAGHTAWDTAQYIQHADYANFITDIVAIAPDLVMVQLGINDWGHNLVTPAQYKTNLLTLLASIDGLTKRPSVLMIDSYDLDPTGSSNTATQNDYKAKVMEVVAADTTTRGFLDFGTTMPPADTSGTGYYSTDGIHPNNSGHVEIARQVINRITPGGLGVITYATETFPGANGAAWPSQWTMGAQAGTADQQSGTGRILPATGAYVVGKTAYLTGMSSVTDFLITCDIGFGGTGVEQYTAISVTPAATLHTSAIGPVDGYSLQFAQFYNTVNLKREVANTETDLAGDTIYAYVNGTRVNVEWRKQSATHTIYVWNVGSSKPTTPTISFTDGTPYAGAGKFMFSNSNGAATTALAATLDNLSITNGATAVATLPVPGQPTGLAATPQPGQVTLTWNPPTDAGSYTVYRNGSALASGITALTYTDATGTQGVSYTYTVSSTNATGEGTQSGSASAASTTLTPLTVWSNALSTVTTAPAKLLAIGDSVTEGQGASVRTNRWLDKLRGLLRTANPSGVTGGENYLPSGYFTYAPDSTWGRPATTTGTVTYIATSGSLGYRTAVMSAAATWSLSVTGTSVDIWYATGGTLTYQIDGGTGVPIDTSTETATDGVIAGISLGTAGAHTVKITATTGTVNFEGLTVYNGDTAAGVQIYDSAHTSFTTANHIVDGSNEQQIWGDLAPDLALITLGLNDAGSMTVAQFKSNLQIMINYLKGLPKIPSIMLIACYTPDSSVGYTATTWQTYVQAMKDLATADPSHIKCLDLSASMPAATTAGTGFYRTDGLHPNDSGHTQIANLVSAALVNVTTTTSTVPMAGTGTLSISGTQTISSTLPLAGAGDLSITATSNRTAVTNSFEGGTNGTTISAANSGGTSGNAFDLVTIGSSTPFTFDNTQAAHGTLSLKIAPTASSTTFAEWNTSVGTQTEFWGRAYVYLTATPTASWLFYRVQNAGTNVARIALTSASKIRLDGGSGNTILFTAATGLTLNSWNRIEWHILTSTTVGQFDVRIFRGANFDGTTPDESSSLAATQNLGTQATQYQFGGVQGSATVPGTFWLDDVGISSVGYLGSAASPATTSALALAGAGSLTVAGTQTISSTVPLTGAGTLTAAPSQAVLPVLVLAGTGALSVSGTNTISAPVTLAGTSSFSVTPTLTLSNNFEGATTGVTLTGANQGAGNDVLTLVKTGAATIQATNTAGEIIHGTTSAKLVTAAGETARLAWTGYSLGDGHVRAYFQFPTAPTVDTTVMVLQGATGPCASVVMRSGVNAGRVALTNANSGTTPTGGVSPSGTPLTFPCVVGLDLACDPGTSTADGLAQLDVYLGSGQTPWFSTGEITSDFFRTGTIQEFREGILTSGAWTIEVDSILAGSGYTLQGPMPVAATVNATVSLSGTSALGVTAVEKVLPTLTFSGTSTLAITGTDTVPVTLGLAGSGTLTTSPQVITQGALSLTGSGALSVSATDVISATLALAGAGALTVFPTLVRTGILTLAGAGALSISAILTHTGSLSMTGTSSLTVTPSALKTSVVSVAGSGILTITPTVIRPNWYSGIAIPGTHLAFDCSQEQLDLEMQYIATTGAGWVRFDLAAVQIEVSNGVRDWTNIDRIITSALTHGLSVLPILTTLPAWSASSYQVGPSGSPTQTNAFTAFCAAAVNRYKTWITYWEIWNEPNNPAFWLTPNIADYTALLIATYPVIKAADPNAVVLVGGVAGGQSSPNDTPTWFTGLYSNGGKNFYDIMNTHPYPNGGSPPDPTSGEMGNISAIRAIMASNGDAGKTFVGTETGFPTAGANSVSESGQATLLTGLINYWTTATGTQRGPLFIYTMRDLVGSQPDREGYFGLLRNDFSAKPGYDAVYAANVATQGIISSAVTMAGSSSLTVTPLVTHPVTVTLAGAGALVVTATPIHLAVATMAGAGALAIIASQTVFTSVSLAGAGTLAVTATTTRTSPIPMAGIGTLSISGTQTISSTVSLAGTGTLSVAATVTRTASLALAGAGTLTVSAATGISATITLAGAGTLAISSTKIISASLTLSGAGVFTVSSAGGSTATVPLASAGVLSITATDIISASPTFSGTGTLVVTAAVRTIPGVLDLAGAGTLSITGTASGTTSVAMAGTGTLTVTASTSGSTTLVFTGAGTLTIVALKTISVTQSFTGTGTCVIAAVVVHTAALNLPGTGTLSLAATVGTLASVSLAGTGALNISATVTRFAVLPLAGTGALSIVATVIGQAAVTASVPMHGSGALTVSGVLTHFATVAFSGSEFFSLAGAVTVRSQVQLTGTGGMQIIATRVLVAQVQLTGAGALNVQATTVSTVSVVLALAGTSTLNITIGRSPGHITIGPPHRDSLSLSSVRVSRITIRSKAGTRSVTGPR